MTGCHTDIVVNTLVPCQQAQMTDTACLLQASCFKRRSSLRAYPEWCFFFFENEGKEGGKVLRTEAKDTSVF